MLLLLLLGALSVPSDHLCLTPLVNQDQGELHVPEIVPIKTIPQAKVHIR